MCTDLLEMTTCMSYARSHWKYQEIGYDDLRDMGNIMSTRGLPLPVLWRMNSLEMYYPDSACI